MPGIIQSTRYPKIWRKNRSLSIMKQLKDIYYNPAFYKKLSTLLAECEPKISRQLFYKSCIKNLSGLELKQRIRHTTIVCHQFFPDHFPEALKILYKLKDKIHENSFSYIFMPDYVAAFGQAHYKQSIQALKDFTSLSSSELAIREFLRNEFNSTMKVLFNWSNDVDYHVRRLACEGTRPRLPWATRVKELLENPELTFPILETLKSDSEKYVQKSVANHINDISKDHPEFIVSRIAKWDRNNKNTDWIIQHGMRSLVKKGDPKALKLFNLHKKPEVRLNSLKMNKTLVLGEKPLIFDLSLTSTKNRSQKLCIDYRIHYVKKSGKHQPKTFKLKTIDLLPFQTISLRKKHLFKNFTTRRHYSGKHIFELVINGESFKSRNFELQT